MVLGRCTVNLNLITYKANLVGVGFGKGLPRTLSRWGLGQSPDTMTS